MMPRSGEGRRPNVAMSKKDILAMLGSVGLFEGLSKRELAAILASSKVVEVREGKVVVEEGSTGVGFHLILEGEARVTVGGRNRATLRPGNYFGEMSLLDGGPRSATVTATTPVRTLSITSWAFLPLIDDYPSIARKLLIELSRRLRAVERSLEH
jgi:CRP/FNR family transcriptional regulator, cyclic AMP receptor protein